MKKVESKIYFPVKELALFQNKEGKGKNNEIIKSNIYNLSFQNPSFLILNIKPDKL